MRVLVVEDEPFMADAIGDGLRPEAIAVDVAGARTATSPCSTAISPSLREIRSPRPSWPQIAVCPSCCFPAAGVGPHIDTGRADEEREPTRD
jgi:hypothetical protein